MKLDSIFKKQQSPSTRGIDMSQYGVGGLNSGESESETSESGGVTPNTSSFKGNLGSIKDQIAAKESRGEKNPYRAFNSAGGGEGAVGKYQFRWKKWKSDIQKVTGIKTIEEFKNNPQAQEDYMDYHLKNHNYPFIQEVKKYDKNGLSESDIIKLIHFRGLPDAKKYVQGNLNQRKESYNMTGNEYLGRPKHALGAVLPLVQTGISLVSSVIDAERKRKEMNKVNSMRLTEQQQMIQNNSEAVLNQYPVYGDFRGGFYRDGGKIDNTNVKKPISVLDIEKNKKNYYQRQLEQNKTYLSKQKNVNPNVKQIFKNGQLKKEANDRVNKRQDLVNTAALAASPVPVVGEILGAASGIANGVVDLVQGEYDNAALSAIPYGVSKIPFNKLGNKYLPNAYKANPFANKGEDGYVDLMRIQEKNDIPLGQQAREGKLSPAWLNTETTAKRYDIQEKHFGEWFTNDKADIDWYRNDRRFKDPEIINLKVPKEIINEYSVKKIPTANELSFAHDREFIIPKTEQNNFKPDWLKGYKKLMSQNKQKFQDGGKIDKPKPVYVESKKDPRYRAYQDSLQLYNTTIKNEKLQKSFDKKAQNTSFEEYQNLWDKHLESGIPVTDIRNLYKTKYRELQDNQTSKIIDGNETDNLLKTVFNKPSGKIKPIKGNLYTDKETYWLNPIYKKPQQPVLIKPRPKVPTNKYDDFYYSGEDVTEPVMETKQIPQEAGWTIDPRTGYRVRVRKDGVREYDTHEFYNKFKKPVKDSLGTRTYAQGGSLPQYEVEGGEVVQGDAQLQSSKKIASDLHHVTGATHEEGGVVGQGGERVFSNRLSIPVKLLALLRKSKIKADPLSTYADVAVNLGKMKGKFESKLGSYKPRTVNTGKLMLERVDGLLDMVFNTQEQSKLPVFAKGGKLPKYAYGQPIKPRNLSGLRKYSVSPFFDDKPANEVITLPPYKNRFPNSNSPLTGLEPTINDSNPNKLPQAEVIAPKIPRKPLSINNVTGFQTQNLGDRIKPISYPQQEGVPETGNLQYKPDNANLWLTALGAVGNTLINSKYDTSVKRNLMQNSGYTYNDRSGLSQWQTQQAYRTGLKSLDLSTSQGTQNNAANMMWKTQNVLSQIHNQENQRRDQYNSQYADSVWRTQAANTGIVNQANDMRRDLKNDKLAGYQNILNNTIGNVNTILSERDARRLEADKLNWIGRKGNLGGRNITDFRQEELDRILGLTPKKKK